MGSKPPNSHSRSRLGLARLNLRMRRRLGSPNHCGSSSRNVGTAKNREDRRSRRSRRESPMPQVIGMWSPRRVSRRNARRLRKSRIHLTVSSRVVSCCGHPFLDPLCAGKIFELVEDAPPDEGAPLDERTPPDDLPSTDTWQSANGSAIVIRHPEAGSREEHVESVSGSSRQDNLPPPAALPPRKLKRFRHILAGFSWPRRGVKQLFR